MALDQITQAVLEAARTEADLILKTAKKAADDNLASAKKAAELEADRRYQAMMRASEEELSRKLIQLQGAANKEVLQRKNAVMRQVFTEARKRILALPVEEYASILSNNMNTVISGRMSIVRNFICFLFYSFLNTLIVL